jgi:23S rRNA (cytidine1920-2'-O)/16S rRNA (cytidine1409-2'-O)-methyltransferase
MSRSFVSRGGEKLAHALDAFAIDPTGGFTDCLLQRGAARVFAVDRGYGVLDQRLRSDARVVVMERTDALRLRLAEPVDLVTIDAGWTRQALILPVACRLLKPGGRIISLVKPQYEAEPAMLRSGVLPDEAIEPVLSAVRDVVGGLGLVIGKETASPIRGQGGNAEWLWLLTRP